MPLSIACCLLAVCYVSQLAYCMPPGDSHVGPLTSKLPEAFIIGGKPSSNWPWQVYIEISSFRCGGSIINQYWVVTAAHCVQGAKFYDVMVYAAVYDREKDRKTVYHVSKIIRHPQYGKPNSYDNDIALLQLTEGVKFTKAVSPVCLPEKDVSVGTTCIATGWGKGGGDTLLRAVSIDIRSPSTCTWRFNHFNEDLMLCVGTRGAGACGGDSGGPLVHKEDRKYYLYGIFSQYKGNCGDGAQIFVRVWKYVNWIKNEAGSSSESCGVRDNGLSTGAIVGIVFGAIGGLIVIVLVVALIWDQCCED